MADTTTVLLGNTAPLMVVDLEHARSRLARVGVAA